MTFVSDIKVEEGKGTTQEKMNYMLAKAKSRIMDLDIKDRDLEDRVIQAFVKVIQDISFVL